ncbi:hypothetical protein M3027_19660 [Geoalkalibacter halelectricus]|nr:hypothetical protein [Geoalkalibacter halelectricus]MDO3380330.1 hypothetical protein [Geoalkalibacter halelectricus]
MEQGPWVRGREAVEAGGFAASGMPGRMRRDGVGGALRARDSGKDVA